MSRHPRVAEADYGVRFGLLIPGGRRHTPGDGWVCPDYPAAAYLRAGALPERLGFDAVFAGDYSWIFPDPFVALSSLAAVTSRIRLGTLVVSVYLRHPAYLSRLVADLDRLSPGRFILGVGIGESEDQLRSVEIPVQTSPDRQDGLEEALAIVRCAWGDEAHVYEGRVAPAIASISLS